MTYTLQLQLFQTVANEIQGKWHSTATDETLIFSPTAAPLDVSELRVIKDGVVHNDHYLMGISTNFEIYLVLGDAEEVSNAIVKVITKDKLILQLHNQHIRVYQRFANTQFADEVIAGL